MATYNEIHGINIQHRDIDATAIEGDVWYNKISGKLKLYSAVGAWATGGNLTTARESAEGVGNSTEAMMAGGYNTAGSPKYTNLVEDYDGSSWTEIADLNTSRGNHGAGGTVSAASVVGGVSSPPTVRHAVHEQWNGTSWTEAADLNTGRSEALGILGIANTSLVYMGGTSPQTTNTETWDGTSWTEGSNYSSTRSAGCGYGLVTAGGGVGGNEPTASPTYSGKHETYDGSSFTEAADLNQVRSGNRGGGDSGDAGITFCGDGDGVKFDNTEEWNGTAWTEGADVPGTDFSFGGGSGTTSNAISAGGNQQNNTDVAASYHWTTAASVQTVAFD